MNNKIKEREILFNRYIWNDKITYKTGKALDLKSFDICEVEWERAKKYNRYFAIPSESRDKLIKELKERLRSISDEKLVELFSHVEPKNGQGLEFRGNFYIYKNDGHLKVASAWDEVKRNVIEVLNETGETGWAFLKAIIIIHEKEKWSRDFEGASFSDILSTMRQLSKKFVYPSPRIYPILKSYGLYYKSGSRQYPTHSIPEEIIPAVDEALNTWKEGRKGYFGEDVRSLKELKSIKKKLKKE
jgi:hypothetical protein